ncbi:MAG: ABC transporter substrate-binding protein [Actinomycetota bacterium]
MRGALPRLVRLTMAALSAIVAVALLASACGDPSVPVAASGIDALITATPTAAPPTPTPTITPTPTPTPQIGATPEPTPLPQRQPGLDEDSVRIAVIADVRTNGTADDLFVDAQTAVQAWAMQVNERGGVGDHEVIVAPLDTSLFRHREALDVVCNGNYFAIVGSQSLQDYEGAEILGTEACDIADFSGDVHGARRAESPNTFVPNPIHNDVRQAGPARWLFEEFPDVTENVATFWFDELQLRVESERLEEMLVDIGFNVSAIETNLAEGASEALIERYEELESQAIVWNADPHRLIDLLGELAANDLTPTWTLCEGSCYSEDFIRQGGDAVEGVYTWIPYVPFGGPNESPELIGYQYWLDQTAPDARWSAVGVQAWMAALLFEEAFNTLLEVEPEQPTRERLIDAARSIDGFEAGGLLTADGLYSSVNVGERQASPCFALVVVRNGRWEQVHPPTSRPLDCSSDNLFDLVATRNRGLEAPVATSSQNSEDAAAEVDE